MHDERRRSHLAKKLSNIEFAHRIVVTGSAFWRRGSALQFIEEIDLVLCTRRPGLWARWLRTSKVFGLNETSSSPFRTQPRSRSTEK
jgi:hypothetical protein